MKIQFSKLIDIATYLGIDFLLGIIIGFLLIVWGIFISAEIAMSDTPNIIIRGYGNLALTLFGFTLIGGIFEKRNKEDKSTVKRQMFLISLIFLLSAMSFILSSTLYGTEGTLEMYLVVCDVACSIGISSFIFGVLYLMVVLIKHFRNTP